MDVLVSAAVLFTFIRSESSRLGVRRWWLPWLPILATLLIGVSLGVSLGLPLFLYLRERAMEQRTVAR